MISVRLNNLSFKYERYTPPGCKDKAMRKFEFVVKTPFLLKMLRFFNKNKSYIFPYSFFLKESAIVKHLVMGNSI